MVKYKLHKEVEIKRVPYNIFTSINSIKWINIEIWGQIDAMEDIFELWN